MKPPKPSVYAAAYDELLLSLLFDDSARPSLQRARKAVLKPLEDLLFHEAGEDRTAETLDRIDALKRGEASR